MTTVTLLPNGVALQVGTFQGYNVSTPVGTAFETLLSDANNATHVQAQGDAYMWLNMSTATIPTGSMVRSVRVHGVARWWGTAGTIFNVSATVPSKGTVAVVQSNLFQSSFYTLDSPESSVPLVQADIDGLQVGLAANNHGQWDVADVWIDLTYTTAPTVTPYAPTGTLTTTNTPTVTWGYAPGDAGGNQSKWRLRLFTSAQYTAGGFDPATTATFNDTGDVVGAAGSLKLSPIANGTYRAYVRASQAINGVDHWSAYAYTEFTINVPTSDITSTVATAQSSSARNQVVVTRNTGTPTWVSAEVQASYDGGTTWSYLRGYTKFLPSGSSFTAYDYEAPNGTAATYRARATYQVSGLDVTGAWVTSSAVTWSSTADWLKDPRVPSRNVAVTVQSIPDMVMVRPQGRFTPLGRRDPVVISDVRHLATGTVTLLTLTDTDAASLDLLLTGDILLLQTPPSDQWGSRYIAVGDIGKHRPSDVRGEPTRIWTVPFAEVYAPADTGLG